MYLYLYIYPENWFIDITFLVMQALMKTTKEVPSSDVTKHFILSQSLKLFSGIGKILF